MASQIAEQDGGNDKMNAQEGERPNDLCALQEEEEEEIDEFADYKSNDMALKSRYRQSDEGENMFEAEHLQEEEDPDRQVE